MGFLELFGINVLTEKETIILKRIFQHGDNMAVNIAMLADENINFNMVDAITNRLCSKGLIYKGNFRNMVCVRKNKNKSNYVKKLK